MIRVTLELVPGGIGEPELLGIIEIENLVNRTMSTGGKRGDYGFAIYKKRKGRITNNGQVNDFPRLSYHPWNLVRQILNKAAEGNGGVI